jgi:transcriptional regulator
MLIHPWDAALDTGEWQDWLASTDRFGMLAVNNLDPGDAPILLPLHFTVAGDELLIHLARPNPVWPHLEACGGRPRSSRHRFRRSSRRHRDPCR